MQSEKSNNDVEGTESNDKIFFTTSDLVTMINGFMKECDPPTTNDSDNGDNLGGFELQRQLPDGSTRKADESEVALADLQSKIKQTADNVAKLPPEEKIRWATDHRQRGNKLYVKQQYKEAMDVYLTCLVAIDLKKNKVISNNNSSSPVTTNSNNVVDNDTDDENYNRENESTENKNDSDLSKSSHDEWIERIEIEIKLPVLMNLSACTLKLGMHRKTCTFCNMAIEMKSGSINPKVYFRRGKSHMLLGLYKKAQADFDKSLELLESYDEGVIIDLDKRKNEVDAVHKELTNLSKLIDAAEKNRKRHEKAMKTVFSDKKRHGRDKESNHVSNAGHNSQNTDSGSSLCSVENLLGCSSKVDETKQVNGLYSDIHKTSKREYSTLRAKRRRRRFAERPSHSIPQTVFLWCIKMLEFGLRKILFWLGDEDAMTRSYLDDEEQVINDHSRIHQDNKSKQL